MPMHFEGFIKNVKKVHRPGKGEKEEPMDYLQFQVEIHEPSDAMFETASFFADATEAVHIEMSTRQLNLLDNQQGRPKAKVKQEGPSGNKEAK